MAIFADETKCIGCGRCIVVCPGNIIRRNKDGKAYLANPQECWSCVSCMKECPVGAISLTIPPQLGGRGGHMFLQKEGSATKWTIEKSDGDKEIIITDTKEANRY